MALPTTTPNKLLWCVVIAYLNIKSFICGVQWLYQLFTKCISLYISFLVFLYYLFTGSPLVGMGLGEFPHYPKHWPVTHMSPYFFAPKMLIFQFSCSFWPFGPTLPPLVKPKCVTLFYEIDFSKWVNQCIQLQALTNCVHT